LDGADVLHATARSRVSGWGVGVNIPYSLLTRPLGNSLLAWGVSAALAIAIALALGLLFARPITTSLSVATNAAAAFGRGEPSAVTGSRLKETDTFLVTLREAHHAREKLTEEVTQSREWLRVTLSSIGDAVIATDIDGTITFLNHVAESLTGWTARDAVGLPLQEVFRIVNEETRLPVGNPAMRAIQQGVAGGLANQTVLVTKDGMERPIADAGAPIRNAAGTTLGAVLIFRDVTEQRRAQETIEQSLKTFFDLVERSPFGIYIVDASFRISHMNAHAQTRAFQNVRPVIGRDFAEAMRILWPEPVASEIISTFRKTLDTGEPFYSPRFVNRRRDIEAVEGYEWELQRITLPDGQFGVICYYYDSTALRHAEDEARESARRATQAEEKLKEADHRKDEFLATLAHELRNPLAPIRVALEFLHRADGDHALIERARNVMDRQVGQMVRLVDDLLDVSRISSGKLQLRKERIELAGVVQTAVETARPLIDASAHELTVSMPTEAILVDADPARLAQVVANLLNNAAKYTEKGGHIWLTVDRRGDRVVLSVRDTGIGIPADQLGGIFQMFAQITPALERSQGGLGIGLSLVKGLVELHDGTVEARSGGAGKGSEFSVELPIAAAVTLASEQPEPATFEEQVRAVGKRRVLVVDDLQDAADSWAMMLQMMGHETRTANDGVEAVQAAAAFRPHMVLLDIGLPKMNGYEVARRIRSESWGADVVLVALTGWGQAEDKRRSLEAGFNHHLTKPIDPAALQDLLASPPVTGAT
jgi:PAS domain S-box-containing protein